MGGEELGCLGEGAVGKQDAAVCWLFFFFFFAKSMGFFLREKKSVSIKDLSTPLLES